MNLLQFLCPVLTGACQCLILNWFEGLWLSLDAADSWSEHPLDRESLSFYKLENVFVYYMTIFKNTVVTDCSI